MAKLNGFTSSASTRDAIQNSIGLLVSILVRYPEVATCKLSPGDGSIKFTYILRGELPKDTIDRFAQELNSSLEVFHQLQTSSNIQFDFSTSRYDDFTLLEIVRDYATLTRQEIALVTALVALSFRDKLVLDDFSGNAEDELDMQDEIIENMLEDTRFDILPKDLIGFRENGRVFVYNKPN